MIEGKGLKVDTTKKFCRFRQMAPTKCIKGSFRTKEMDEDTKIILCKKKGSNKLTVQSILQERKGQKCKLVK